MHLPTIKQLTLDEISRLENKYAQSFSRSRRKDLLMLKQEIDAYKQELKEMCNAGAAMYSVPPLPEKQVPVYSAKPVVIPAKVLSANQEESLVKEMDPGVYKNNLAAT